MTAGPVFVQPHTPDSEGVDYLGLRALNLSMMDGLLPGVNNVVSLVRPFTLMSWVAWRFEQGVARRPTVSTKDFEVFKEKVETVFVYSQVQAGDADGLPGRQQRVPAGDVIRFQFSAFNRSGSILDAALYGPSIKNLTGLGFLSSEMGFFKVTEHGQKLALALDTLLKAHLSHEQYEFISSVDINDAPKSLVDERFYKAWSISDVSPEEQQTFRSRLLQPESIGRAHPDGRRSAVLQYALACLRQEQRSMTVGELRHSMACRFPVALEQHASAGTFRLVQRHWQLLQVRQAQRLALESLFGWVERCLLHHDAVSIDDLVALARSALRLGSGSPAEQGYLRAQMQRLRAVATDLDGLFAAGLRQPEELDVLVISDALEAAMKQRQPADEMVILAVRLLLLCACYAEAFAADDATKNEVGAGPRFRMPLGMWAEFVRNHDGQALGAVLHKMLGSFVISQHLGVAAARSSDEKSRMRLSIEDRGLTSVLSSLSKALVPRRTADRLASSFALLADCGLVQEAVTGSGRSKRLSYSSR